ncbi:transketolase C-terminal domain-containing protein [Siphonobacter aquaeclarae]|jgi:transketolase|uniref:Transketolase n=1 Tax=Siphonobacter aquaeclarae TaxID=563176 RepID=A0A1G9YC87_9BACT|nr:transketolase C-terminal domain-containing protein [Siphonobacter aquaeclarae]SDN06688.1 transketolase [Siphonobacter aquaeclarae]
MRNEFSKAIEQLALADDKILFITGDLGYKALENVQASLGPRFINAGVAEQNMVGMAAGMAYKGYKVICYSIAPFVVYRCHEQFRNDVCLHNLPVFLVGNGGGYGYGIMGSTHHAIEDIAVLSPLQNVTCWVPAFADEVEECVSGMVAAGRPAYLRLGYGPNTPSLESVSGSFKILQRHEDAEGTVLALGPIAANVLKALEKTTRKFNVLTALTLPLQVTDEVADLLENAGHVVTVEEHVSIGGLGQQLSLQLLERGTRLKSFRSLRAAGYPQGLYGDQSFHQQQSGLDPDSILNVLTSLRSYAVF